MIRAGWRWQHAVRERMRLGGPVLWALGAVTSIASAMGTLALDHAGIIRLGPVEELTDARIMSFEIIPPQPTDPVRRFAYVSLDAGRLSVPPPRPVTVTLEAEPAEGDDTLPEEVIAAAMPEAPEPEAEIADPWVVETRPNKTAPEKPTRLGGAYSKRLPADHLLDDPRLTRRLAQISPGASRRLDAKFRAANADWQPADVALVAIKDEKVLELHARPEGGEWKFIHRYPVLAASGKTGPKLRQGDRQVPEGVYNISFLNPNSKYHVSLRVNYPNSFDREMAAQEGRGNLGGDIMIHGKAVSAGCLAVGDEAAEELFLLAAQTGLSNIKVIIAPTDFRRRSTPTVEAAVQPKWLPKLYSEVAVAMADYKAPPPSIGLLSYFWN